MDTKTKGPQSVRESMYTGAVYGVIAWMIYAVVEYFFSALLPWIMKPSHTYIPVHRAFTLLLFVIYPVTGLILGALSGLCLRAAAKANLSSEKTEASMFGSSATLTVVLIFNVNLLYIWLFTGYDPLPLLPSFGISIILLLALVVSIASPLWYGRLRFLTNPWTVAIALFGILPWVMYEPLRHQTKTVMAIAALVYPIVVFLISLIFHKIAAGRATPVSPARAMAFLIPVYCLVFVTGLFLEQTPLRTGLKVESSLKDPDRPNVILITMDTVRADHLSLYGYERDTTPNLRKLAEESTLYNQSIATSDITLPSHASIFTGLYARSNGSHHFFRTPTDEDMANHFANWPATPLPLADKFTTLAEILFGKGYSTMAVVANPGYLDYHYNLNQGFNFYDYRSPVIFLGNVVGTVNPFYLRQTIHNLISWIIPASGRDNTYRRAGEINEVVFSLIDKAKKENNSFFMFINYMDAHTPYDPPAPYYLLFPGKDETFTEEHYREMEREVSELRREITVKERQHLVSQYDGGIAYEDYHIGNLIARLKESGMYDNSLIIVTSDHGEVFGDRNYIGHGNSVYQSEVRVPLVIKYPQSSRKAVVDEFVSGVDLMPTVLDVFGYEIPGDIQGSSLLKPEDLYKRKVISESFPDRNKLSFHKRFHRIERAIFSGTDKFVGSTSGKQELYDLSKDPEEKEDIFNADDSVSRNIKAELDQWLEDVKEELPSKEGSDSYKAPDKAVLDRLKALGYVQ